MLNQVAPLPLKDPSLFRQANFIDGKWVEADSGATLTVRNPATGETMTKPADKVVKVSVAKALKDSING